MWQSWYIIAPRRTQKATPRALAFEVQREAAVLLRGNVLRRRPHCGAHRAVRMLDEQPQHVHVAAVRCGPERRGARVARAAVLVDLRHLQPPPPQPRDRSML